MNQILQGDAPPFLLPLFEWSKFMYLWLSVRTSNQKVLYREVVSDGYYKCIIFETLKSF